METRAGRRDASDCKVLAIAVRETGVSLHHGGLIEGAPETSRTSQHYLIEGFIGAFNWALNSTEGR